MLKVKNKSTGEIFTVQKYTLSGGEEPTENVWCVGWYGRHVIGNDCEWVVEHDFTVDELSLIYFTCDTTIASQGINLMKILNINNVKSKISKLAAKIIDESSQ